MRFLYFVFFYSGVLDAAAFPCVTFTPYTPRLPRPDTATCTPGAQLDERGGREGGGARWYSVQVQRTQSSELARALRAPLAHMRLEAATPTYTMHIQPPPPHDGFLAGLDLHSEVSDCDGP